tara:strand:- start:105 stop:659 length:555 start_codon:yes stop_codon:yes gene_type:complete
MEPRLYKQYNEQVKPTLQKEGGYANVHQVPRVEKIVVNMGVSSDLEKSALDDAVADLQAITGRKPVISKSRKNISNFKLRIGMPVGCFVTLRRGVMYEFLDRLTTAALPCIRDFRGISNKAFDGRGNYSLGISDQTIFPEIEVDKVKRQQGMDITIVTSARTDAEALDLLSRLGLPFAGQEDND